MTTNFSVEELKELNFDKLNKQEKLRVKLRGQPTSKIKASTSQPSTSHGKKYIGIFKEKQLDERQWLCSRSVTNYLYGFLCLIFNTGGRSSFVKLGFRNIGSKCKVKQHVQL